MPRTLQLQFDTGTWLKDPAVTMCSPGTRGIWIDMLCAMHENNRCGQLIGTASELSRVCRCTEAEITAAITELKHKRAADITEFVDGGSNAIVTVVNRRMRRDYEIREQGAKRAQRFRDNNRNLPTSPEAKRIADIFKRSHDTPWSDKEIQAFRAIGKIDEADLAVLEVFYKVAKHDEKAYLRTGLQAFLNNFRSEVDKARAWTAKNPRLCGNGHKPPDDPEPPQFRAWLSQTYPTAPPEGAWAMPDIRRKFSERKV